MRKIAANYIFPVTATPLKNGIIVIDEKNYIVDIVDTKGQFKEIQNLEFYSGVIVPGFIDVFTLLSFPSFSEKDFEECFRDDFGSALKKSLLLKETTPNTIQRGINQLEAYGTVAVADFFTVNNHAEQKRESKLSFSDINLAESNCSLQIPISNKQLNPNQSILLNRIILEKFKGFTPAVSEMSQYCIGTGSLGTHLKLSVFEELKALQEILPTLAFWELIKWGTINGAKHLQIENEFGSLEIGKKPGLNLLTNLDYSNQKFNAASELKILV
ncbi:amidohydrolase family protein [Labilibaculum sp. K2S]|uniref:amidohydrolase family protein n=1 Tax=Labilibaculum sp. K2S TaxID=3056386 RepID=UPI0025A43EA6|nr:amidohydrolase family protein [Labilibaculum sp. K2S]MDM8161199.1 amidohydrolase family protein [Labilibaculum sp. K2S]